MKTNTFISIHKDSYVQEFNSDYEIIKEVVYDNVVIHILDEQENVEYIDLAKLIDHYLATK